MTAPGGHEGGFLGWRWPGGWQPSEVGVCPRCDRPVLWCWNWDRTGTRESFDRDGGVHVAICPETEAIR